MIPQLHKADIANLETLMALENACFDSERISPRQMRYLLTKAKACTWLLSVDGVAAAYAMYLLPTLPRPARLYSLAVSPKHQGQGLALKLLSTTRNSLAELGYPSMRLEVDVTNTKAVALYRQFGFKVTKTLPQYYENGHDGVQMALTLCNNK